MWIQCPMTHQTIHSDPSPSCPSVRQLAQHVADAAQLAPDDREWIVEHLRECPTCCEMYGLLCDMDETHHQASTEPAYATAEDTAGSIKVSSEPLDLDQRAKAVFARDWERIEASQPAEPSIPRWWIHPRHGAYAAAACILLVFGWLAMARMAGHPSAGTSSHPNSPVASIELVNSRGNTPLALGQTVATSDQPQEILLGGMHRVVMNRDTRMTVSISLASGGTHAGMAQYDIQLSQGELYVEVVPGNPFTVQTPNARLEITGTQFDVSAAHDTTELSLLKGSIRFSSLDASHPPVSVTAGHASSVVTGHGPTAPATSDAMAVAAWARDTALANAIGRATGYASPDLSDLSAISQGFWKQSSPVDVDRLDYRQWRDEHRNGPLARAALAQLPADKARDADWIEVLMVSGEIWQFHYDPKQSANQPLTEMEPQAITRLARHYGLEEKVIYQAMGRPVPPTATSTSDSTLTPGQQYAQALIRWHDAVVAAVERPDNDKSVGDLKMFSLYASHYLAETRTAAYLWTREHPEEAQKLLAEQGYIALLPATKQPAAGESLAMDSWVKDLNEQANAAQGLVPAAMEWLMEPEAKDCGRIAATQLYNAVKVFLYNQLTSGNKDVGKS